MTAKFRKTVTTIAIVAVAGLGASAANAGTTSCFSSYWTPLGWELKKKGEIGHSVTKKTKGRIYVHLEARPGTVQGLGQCINMTVKFKLANGNWSTVPENRTICTKANKQNKKTYDFNRAAVDYSVSCT
jgi:hypothetical protein